MMQLFVGDWCLLLWGGVVSHGTALVVSPGTAFCGEEWCLMAQPSVGRSGVS